MFATIILNVLIFNLLTTATEPNIYKIGVKHQPIGSSKTQCQKYGSHLVSIETPEEFDQIYKLVKTKGEIYYWTSGKFIDNEWRWESPGNLVIHGPWCSDANLEKISEDYNVVLKEDGSHACLTIRYARGAFFRYLCEKYNFN